MVLGLGFISIALFIYIQERYDIKNIDGERVFNRKKESKDRDHRFKMVISLLSLVLGIFRIVSSII